MKNLMPFDNRNASPSYKEMGTGKPKCVKVISPIKIIVVAHSPNREQRRENERSLRYRKSWFSSLGEKHRTRLAKAGLTG